MSANMFAQRAVQLSMRRLAASNPSTLTRSSSIAGLLLPASIAGQRVQSRSAASTSISNDKAYDILAKQRLNRPLAPHLSIYRPQITWIGSSLNRVTAVALSGSFYIFGLAYLVAPLMGWHLESASLAASFAALPILAKVGIKMVAAFPFTYHSFKGLQHFLWDVGAQLTNRQVNLGAWAVVWASVLSAVGLAFI